MLLTAACSTPAPAPAPESQAEQRKYLLERVDDAAVVQLYADGFSALPLDQKVLIWHLAEAAIAGRDIFYDQVSADALEMRDVLEADPHARGEGRSEVARRDSPLHHALLDQHRALQQPDRAEVRAQPDAAGIR